jgi:hypothetical protein
MNHLHWYCTFTEWFKYADGCNMTQSQHDIRISLIYFCIAAKSDGDVPNEDDSGLDNERGYTSDSELSRVTVRQHSSLASRPTTPELSPNSGGGWILVSHSMFPLGYIES